MPSKIIIGACLTALLLFGVILAQTGNGRRTANSNMLVNGGQEALTNRSNVSNSNSLPEARQPGSTATACQYLTQPDAEKILEGKVNFDGGSVSSDNVFSCRYSTGSRATNIYQFIKFEIKNFATEKQARAANTLEIKEIELSNAEFDGMERSTIKLLPGIGENAVLVTNGGQFTSIYFQKNRVKFAIQIYHGDAPISIGELKLIARKIAETYVTANAE